MCGEVKLNCKWTIAEFNSSAKARKWWNNGGWKSPMMSGLCNECLKDEQ